MNVLALITTLLAARSLDPENEEKIRAAYQDVRSDATETTWLLCTYEGKEIVLSETGSDYDDCLEQLRDDMRAYVYLRVETGDEMNRRAKFAFITWIGPAVSPLKKAKVSTDKAFLKEILKNFSKEILADEKSELKLKTITDTLNKASGAHYGTGQ